MIYIEKKIMFFYTNNRIEFLSMAKMKNIETIFSSLSNENIEHHFKNHGQFWKNYFPKVSFLGVSNLIRLKYKILCHTIDNES